MEPVNKAATRSSQFTANVYRSLIVVGIAVLLGGALTVPYYYETQTLWYKVGPDRMFLRAGQLAGLLTLVLLVLQIFAALRVKLFENLFGGAQLMRWHRINGVLIACTALSHVALALVSEGINNLPIGKKYWPEMIGGLLFLLILIMVVSSHFRTLLQLAYPAWRMVHRPLGYLALVLVLLHVLFVSESFTHTLPRTLLLTLFAGLALFTGVVQKRRWSLKS